MSVKSRIIALGGLCIWLAIVLTVAPTVSGLEAAGWIEDQFQEADQLDSRMNVIEWAIRKNTGAPSAPPTAFPTDLPEESFTTYERLVLADGTVLAPEGQPTDVFESSPGPDSVPLSVRVANDGRFDRTGPFGDIHVAGSRAFRVHSKQIQPGVALQVAMDVDSPHPPHVIENELFPLIVLGGAAFAFPVAGLIALIATRPIRRLSRKAERAAESNQVVEVIPVEGSGDMRRLIKSFNRVIEALRDSLKSQRQLVTDASHELRTPLTSLRTNIEVLLRVDSLPPEDQKKLLRDVVEQIDELTFLISDLTDLARVGDSAPEAQDVRLDRIVERTVRRMERHWPKVSFALAIEPTSVRGVASKIERAVSNILDNAAKWSPEGGTIEVSVASGELRVRDNGPGISDADLPHIFERFYRADDTRGQPGSGIGLAIVQQVAESHGGSVSAQNAQGGGAIVRMTLPQSQLEPV